MGEDRTNFYDAGTGQQIGKEEAQGLYSQDHASVHSVPQYGNVPSSSALPIVSVTYDRLISHGHYENTRMGATALVNEVHRSAEETLSALQEWVEGQIKERIKSSGEVDVLRNEAWNLQNAINDRRRKLEDLKIRWDQATKVLQAHGIEISEDAGLDEIPF